MSGIIEKVKDKVEQVTHTGAHSKENTTGTTGTHNTGSHATGSHTTGSHTAGATGVGSTNAGPHHSSALNKADPRVDSDLDGSRNAGLSSNTSTGYGGGLAGSSHTSTGHTGGLTGSTGTSGVTGSHSGTGVGSTTAGPHNSNLLNKADPRVDSDLDGSRNAGLSSNTSTGYGSGVTGSGHTSTGHTGGLTGSSHTGGLTGSSNTTAGPHATNTANKLDPRVDSDLDGSRNAGLSGGVGSGYGSSTTGSGYGSTTTGSGFGSTTTGSGIGSHSGTGVGSTTGAGLGSTSGAGLGSHSGPGPASKTAGPHSSDLLNKADPRVDSDLDGSKTYGGNATYQQPAIDDPIFADTSVPSEPRKDSAHTHDNTPHGDATADIPHSKPSPPDASKHSPTIFRAKSIEQGRVSPVVIDNLTDRARERAEGNETRAILEKYGSGMK